MAEARTTTIDSAEVERFSALASEWWNPTGKFRPLHKFNPVRLAYIRDRVAARFGRNPHGARPFEGLRFLDIGCGGGLLCEPMARLGADVVGADASATNIEVARLHASETGLGIDYRASTAEELAADGERFDVVLNMEVVEHVADRPAFLGHLARPVRPGGGLVVLSTLNRTPRAYLLAKLGAEYLLRWLPVGTHDWRLFVTPAELGAELRGVGLRVSDIAGMTFDPLRRRFRLSRDVAVNYLIAAVR